MKVILLEDVYKHGVAGEVVAVADGFARNYLIPRGKAVKVTPGALRQVEALRARADVRRAERHQEFGKIAEKIEEMTLYFGMKAGESGKLYGSVTPQMVAEHINEEIGLEIDRRRVGDSPLRELGEFAMPVRLDAGLTPSVKVVVFREGEDPREAEAEADAALEVEAEDELEAEAEADFEAETVEETEAEEADADDEGK